MSIIINLRINGYLFFKEILYLILLSFCFFNIANTQSFHGYNASTDSIIVETGWNLISIPLAISDGLKINLFPSATSDAFLYQNEYKEIDTLSNGYGFWIKFNSPETFIIIGDIISYNLIELQPGWNLIGSLTEPIKVSSIRTIPSDIINSDFFHYSAATGYQSSDTIFPGKGYWVKINQTGWIIMDLVTGKPCKDLQSVEYEGKTYTTVQIGGQCWLKENLDVGMMINGNQESVDNGTVEKYCFNNLQSNCNTYGGFYQWEEAMGYKLIAATQGICPPGWHIPTYAEVETLMNVVNFDGNALKAVGQGSDEGSGTNTSGFSALLSGVRGYTGDFAGVDTAAFFWISDWQYGGGFLNGYSYSLYYNISNISVWPEIVENGFNVRCIWNVVGPNRPPTIPSNPFPEDNSIEQPTTLTFIWTADDIEEDTLTFDIFLDVINPPSTVISSDVLNQYLIVGGLNENSTYFWRVIAKDDYGNSTVGPVWTFTTGSWGIPCEGIPIVEYEGKIYHTVQIGTQCWLKENIDVGKHIDATSNQADNGLIEKYCYENDSSKCKIFGGYYQWDEAMQYSNLEGAKGICPTGWHIPSYSEFQICSTTVTGDGNSLKAVGQGSWSGEGTNTSGFSALIVGDAYNGTFENFYNFTSFWSSTKGPEFYEEYSYNFGLFYDGNLIWIDFNDKFYGFSVRCMKD